MKMALKKDPKPVIWIIIAIVMVTLGCNILSLSRADTQPGNLTTQEATSQTMLPPQSLPLENNNGLSCLAGIFPGKTSRAEVIALLGEPLAAQPEGSYEALQYASPLRGQYNTIYLLNQVVDWVSVVLAEDNPLTWSAVKAQYGEPAHTAYSAYLQGSQVFAFPERGLNFTANPDLDAVYLQECFVPMSLENYMQAYGNFLPSENPFTK